MHIASLVGAIAGGLTVFNMFPQYLQVMRTKKTRDLALVTFVSLSCSSSLWVCYGVLRHDHIIILANCPVFFFSLSILVMKIRHG